MYYRKKLEPLWVKSSDFTLYKNNGNVLRQLYKNTVNKNSSVRRTKENSVILTSNCAVYDKKNLTFIKVY